MVSNRHKSGSRFAHAGQFNAAFYRHDLHSMVLDQLGPSCSLGAWCLGSLGSVDNSKPILFCSLALAAVVAGLVLWVPETGELVPVVTSSGKLTRPW